jgi:hypothetical protein
MKRFAFAFICAAVLSVSGCRLNNGVGAIPIPRFEKDIDLVDYMPDLIPDWRYRASRNLEFCFGLFRKGDWS